MVIDTNPCGFAWIGIALTWASRIGAVWSSTSYLVSLNLIWKTELVDPASKGVWHRRPLASGTYNTPGSHPFLSCVSCSPDGWSHDICGFKMIIFKVSLFWSSYQESTWVGSEVPGFENNDVKLTKCVPSASAQGPGISENHLHTKHLPAVSHL